MAGMGKQKKNALIWMDLEMSGLNPDADTILEVAIVITDRRLNIVEEAEWIVHQPDSVLDNMDKWNTKTHTQSGLIARVRSATEDTKTVERAVIKFLKKHANHGESPMCGNSICQDRRFLFRHMPQLEAYFHYRNFDVSSFKIAAQLFYPPLFEQVKNDKSDSQHRALDDTKASIAELQFYLQNMLLPVSDAVDAGDDAAD